MSGSGEKTSKNKLASLAVSVNRTVHSDPKISTHLAKTHRDTSKDSYAEKLAREHRKVLGTPSQEDNDRFKQFIDPPEIPVLKLEMAQIQGTSHSQKQSWKDVTLTPEPTTVPSEETLGIDPSSEPEKRLRGNKTAPQQPSMEAKADIPPPTDQKAKQDTHVKIVAPRALPFSEESHVRVKVIVQDINMNIGHVGAIKSESFTWMQRDAIKHYLTIQDIERHREAMDGAVYRSFVHDA